jgi:hypothetical protein
MRLDACVPQGIRNILARTLPVLAKVLHGEGQCAGHEAGSGVFGDLLESGIAGSDNVCEKYLHISRDTL